MSYYHTQRGYVHWLLWGLAAAQIVLAWMIRAVPSGAVIVVASSALLVGLSFCFMSLTVADAVEGLSVRFGPIPLFGTQIDYRDMRSATKGRSRLLDGWGIHWLPGRGWIYNLWGYDCVAIQLERRQIRIGTDDPDGLLAFLRQRLAVLA